MRGQRVLLLLEQMVQILLLQQLLPQRAVVAVDREILHITQALRGVQAAEGMHPDRVLAVQELQVKVTQAEQVLTALITAVAAVAGQVLLAQMGVLPEHKQA